MPRTCTICRHERRQEIDEALVAGESLRSIAFRFDTSHTAVRRHKEHLSGKLVKAAERAEERHADSLLDQTDALLVRAKALLDEAGSPETLIQVSIVGVEHRVDVDAHEISAPLVNYI